MLNRINRAGRWSDLAGDVWVRATETQVIAERVVGDGLVPVWTVDVPEPLMFLRAAGAPDGRIGAIGKGNRTGRVLVVVDGALTWIGPLTHGNAPVGILGDDEYLLGVYLEAGASPSPGPSGTFAPPTIVWCDLLFGREISRVPLRPAPDGQFSSQGILDVTDDRQILLLDDFRTAVVRGRILAKPIRRGDVLVGQWGLEGRTDADRVMVATPAGVFTALAGYGDDPHLAVLAGGRLLVSAMALREVASLAVIDPPYPAHEPVEVPTGGGGTGGGHEPKKPEKEPTDMAIFETLRQARAKHPASIPADDPANAARYGEMLNTTCWVHRADPTRPRMYRKDAGKAVQPRTGTRIAHQILVTWEPLGDGPARWVYRDVFDASGEGSARPVWGAPIAADPPFVEAVEPVDGPPDPPASSTLEQRVARLETAVEEIRRWLGSVDTLTAAVGDVRATLARVTDDVATLRTVVDHALQGLPLDKLARKGDPVTVTAKVFGVPLVGHGTIDG
jgi:hypothetical protein